MSQIRNASQVAGIVQQPQYLRSQVVAQQSVELHISLNSLRNQLFHSFDFIFLSILFLFNAFRYRHSYFMYSI